jgi:hypothetical protein
MMENCTRHAFTDGQCVHAGCTNCPGLAERRVIELTAIKRDNRWQFAILPSLVLMFGVLALCAIEVPKRFSAVVAAHQEISP